MAQVITAPLRRAQCFYLTMVLSSCGDCTASLRAMAGGSTQGASLSSLSPLLFPEGKQDVNQQECSC